MSPVYKIAFRLSSIRNITAPEQWFAFVVSFSSLFEAAILTSNSVTRMTFFGLSSISVGVLSAIGFWKCVNASKIWNLV